VVFVLSVLLAASNCASWELLTVIQNETSSWSIGTVEPKSGDLHVLNARPDIILQLYSSATSLDGSKIAYFYEVLDNQESKQSIGIVTSNSKGISYYFVNAQWAFLQAAWSSDNHLYAVYEYQQIPFLAQLDPNTGKVLNTVKVSNHSYSADSQAVRKCSWISNGIYYGSFSVSNSQVILGISLKDGSIVSKSKFGIFAACAYDVESDIVRGIYVNTSSGAAYYGYMDYYSWIVIELAAIPLDFVDLGSGSLYRDQLGNMFYVFIGDVNGASVLLSYEMGGALQWQVDIDFDNKYTLLAVDAFFSNSTSNSIGL